MGGAVSVNMEATDNKKGQTMKVKIEGFVEYLQKVKYKELKHLAKKKKGNLEKKIFFFFNKGFV